PIEPLPKDTDVKADPWVFQENANRLEKLQAQHVNPVPSSEPEAWASRRHAPTQMYSNAVAPEAIKIPEAALSQGPFNLNQGLEDFTSKSMAHPDETVAEGELMQATLETAINSDLPGRVRAVLRAPVYSYVGQHVLLPPGSRLIGQYASKSSNGAASARLFIVWTRILTPEGISVTLNSPGSDQLGRAGMGADAIDSHFWTIFGHAALLSILGASVANVGVNSSTAQNSADTYRQNIANALQESAQSALSNHLSIQPTLKVNQGDTVTVFVAQDLDLHSALSEPDN
ncbi:MAG: TrbI/VirB10 family protein, partial [Gammaproteobacteria bacterium]|nr:TrbI/VirB10 family protein [Gammaproteobacteria bacterium]